MATMNISLPDKMKEWVETRAETGLYSNASDYVRDLIRKDQEARDYWSWFDEEVEKGYASGFSQTTPGELLADMKAVIEETDAAAKKRA
jgi:antitoxin ParD1/3/4